MTVYKLYWVLNANIRPGKFAEAARWWREKGAPDLDADPTIVSVRTYAGQFRMGGQWDIEIWQELEDYAAFDRMDKAYEDDPIGAGRRDELWKESHEFFEWGPARLVGDWPESSLQPE